MRLLPPVSILLAVCLAAAAEEKPGDPRAECVRRGKAIEAKDAKGWLELADFCEAQLLFAEREDALRKAVAAEPEDAKARARLDQAKSGDQWLPSDEAEAQETKDKAAQGLTLYGDNKWIPKDEAAKRRDALRPRVNWAFEHAVETEHMKILSSEDLGYTRRLAAILENEAQAYKRFHEGTWKLKPLPMKLKVFLFGSRDQFKQFVGPVPDDTPGGYNPMMGVLAISKTPKGDLDLVTVCAMHEFAHALDHQMCGILSMRVPLWIAEGRATYFGHSLLGRQVIPGAVNMPSSTQSTAANLKGALPNLSLAKLIGMGAQEFQGKGATTNYAVAWAFVHFLYHAEAGKHAAGFGKFLAGVPTGKAAPADFEAAVGKAEDLEAPFRAYVEKVLLPAAEASGKRAAGAPEKKDAPGPAK